MSKSKVEFDLSQVDESQTATCEKPVAKASVAGDPSTTKTHEDPNWRHRVQQEARGGLRIGHR